MKSCTRFLVFLLLLCHCAAHAQLVGYYDIPKSFRGGTYVLESAVRMPEPARLYCAVVSWKGKNVARKRDTLAIAPGTWTSVRQEGSLSKDADRAIVVLTVSARCYEQDAGRLTLRKDGQELVLRTAAQPVQKVTYGDSLMPGYYRSLEYDYAPKSRTGRSGPVLDICRNDSGASNYGRNAQRGHFLETGGAKLYYEVYGSGPPVLLMHGNNQQIGTMSEQINALRKHYTVIALDSRGQGLSTFGTVKLSYDQMAEDASVLLTQLKLGPAAVVGWSDGGINGLLLAMRHPAQVSKLVTMGANLYPDRGAIEPKFLRSYRNEVRMVRVVSIVQPRFRSKYRVGVLPLRGPDIDPKSLETIRVPVLVLAGEHDLVTPAHSRLIAAHLPKGKLQVIPGATHFAPEEAPDTFNRIVLDFLRQP